MAFGNNFTNSFDEDRKDFRVSRRGLTESTEAWFMGGGNKISVTLSGADVPQVRHYSMCQSDCLCTTLHAL